MATQRNRTAAVHSESGEIRDEWFTVETEDGVAVAGVDRNFDLASEEEALRVVQNAALEVGKPLSVVGYTRTVLGTYAAVTKVQKIEKKGDE